MDMRKVESMRGGLWREGRDVLQAFSSPNLGNLQPCAALSFKQRQFTYSESELVSLGSPGSEL
jgi:hypothetical protein